MEEPQDIPEEYNEQDSDGESELTRGTLNLKNGLKNGLKRKI